MSELRQMIVGEASYSSGIMKLWTFNYHFSVQVIKILNEFSSKVFAYNLRMVLLNYSENLFILCTKDTDKVRIEIMTNDDNLESNLLNF